MTDYIRILSVFLLASGLSFMSLAQAQVILQPIDSAATPHTSTEQANVVMPFVRPDKSIYGPSETVMIEYGHLPGHQKDWISIVPANSSDEVYSKNWTYTQGKTSGIYEFDPLMPGEYEARVYFDYPDGGMTVQARYRFTVAESDEAAQAALYNTEKAPAKAAQLFNIRANLICRTIQSIPNDECLTLFELFSVTDGKQWQRNDGWNRTNKPCEWYGVECRDGRIVALKLPNNNLIGSLPDLSALTELTFLWLSNNHLVGAMPTLTALTQLQKLYLNGNALNGSFSSLAGLTQLKSVHIYGNELTGELPAFTDLLALETFYAHENLFTGTIPDLSSLTKLEELDLSYNQLTGPLPDLSNLSSLQYLSLEENQLTGHFPDISRLPGLEGLYLDNNHLCGPIPTSLPLTHPALSMSIANNHLSSDNETVIEFIEQQEMGWQEMQTPCPGSETEEEPSV